MVVMVGVDVHKDTHCAVAVDEAGRPLGRVVTVRATDAGHRQLLAWARRSFPDTPVVFAVEDCRHVSGRLERALLDAAATVVRVPPKLMAQTRSSARTRGKSDPIDALAVARAAVREPDLPRAEHTGVSRQVKLLVDHREDLVAERTRMQNRLRWHLHELDPELDPRARTLDQDNELDRIRGRLAELAARPVEPGPAGAVGQTVMRTVARIAAELLADIAALTARVKTLEKELAVLVCAQAPQLLALPGCGVLTAAKLVGETANPARFAREARFAMHAGVAPIPASSGRTNRHPHLPLSGPAGRALAAGGTLFVVSDGLVAATMFGDRRRPAAEAAGDGHLRHRPSTAGSPHSPTAPPQPNPSRRGQVSSRRRSSTARSTAARS